VGGLLRMRGVTISGSVWGFAFEKRPWYPATVVVGTLIH
jgi:hypothetical protein